jgi:phosphotransferase system  glucose/maltose/N-acetylglucosamine-specific IIC component
MEQGCQMAPMFSNQKITIWLNLGGPRNKKYWYILWPFGNFVVIWYIFPVLVYCIKKNLATPMQSGM